MKRFARLALLIFNSATPMLGVSILFLSEFLWLKVLAAAFVGIIAMLVHLAVADNDEIFNKWRASNKDWEKLCDDWLRIWEEREAALKQYNFLSYENLMERPFEKKEIKH